jgi:LytS/YehU family sensor histidine kinase
MTRYEFIFSQALKHRLTRHVVFWLVFSCHVFLFRYYVPDLKYLTYTSTYLIRLQNLLLFLPVSIFYAYFGIYILLPNYILKERYTQLLLVLVAMSVGLVLLSYLLSNVLDIHLVLDLPLKRLTVVRQMDFTLSNGLVYPLTGSAFAIGIKMGKNFYLEQKQNQLLARQKITAEVQLLKSHVHPRFLFHSLNSIYSKMHIGSEQSPAMLLKLSDLLSYILYESDDKLVPLEKELNLLQNYVDLEKENWGNRLTITIGNEIITEGRYIAPMLLLPLAEYVFEVAEQDQQQQVSLSMNMLMKEQHFWFILTMSGYTDQTGKNLQKNIQLEQVQKRLKVLYPGKHAFKLELHQQAIAISLSILLDENLK